MMHYFESMKYGHTQAQGGGLESGKINVTVLRQLVYEQKRHIHGQ